MIGRREGDRCDRINGEGFACDGEMAMGEPENCSCDISPPCAACTENEPRCDVCEAAASDD